MNWAAVDHYFTLLKHDWPKCHSVLRRTLLDPALRQCDQVMAPWWMRQNERATFQTQGSVY